MSKVQCKIQFYMPHYPKKLIFFKHNSYDNPKMNLERDRMQKSSIFIVKTIY